MSSALKKGRSLIQQTRESGATQKLLRHGANFLDRHGEAIVGRLEGTDVESVIEKGKGVFTDPAQRQLFVNEVKDMALEFLIKQVCSVRAWSQSLGWSGEEEEWGVGRV